MYKISNKVIKKQESEIDKKNFSSAESPLRYIPVMCTFTITICNNDDPTHTYEVYWGLQTYKIRKKDFSPYVYGR